jgi:hypothetical protein
VLSFPFPLRFLLASYPELMSKVLGIVQRVLSTHLINKAGLIRATAQTGAVTLIQRFGSALNRDGPRKRQSEYGLQSETQFAIPGQSTHSASGPLVAID